MSIIEKKKKKHDKVEVVISKALVNSVISHDELVLINNALKENDKMEEECFSKNAFQKISDESNHKPNKIWLD